MKGKSVPEIVRRVGKQPRIVVFKPGGLGDFLATTPALRALRATWPQGHITYIVRPWVVSYCRRYRQIDEVMGCPPFAGIELGPEDEEKLNRFFANLATRDIDLAFQWAGNGLRSNPFVNRLGARLTVGFVAPGAESLDIALPFDDERHEVQRFLDTVRVLGIPLMGDEMEAPVEPEDFAELRRAAPEVMRGRWLGVNACSGERTRRWPAERFAAVADRLVDEAGFDGIAVTGDGTQTEQAAEVVGHLRHAGRAVDLAGRLSLGGLTALFAQLDLLLTNDSGPGHLAAAIGTPSVVVYGSGPPLTWSPVAWVWQRPVADWHSSCRQFVPNCCGELPLPRCLDAVTVEDVLTEARHLIRLATLVTPPNRLRAAAVGRRAG